MIDLSTFLNTQPASSTSPGTGTARKRIAEMLLKQSIDTSPVQHWTQGAARVAQALTGGFELGAAERQEKAETEAFGEKLFGAPPAAPAAVPPTVGATPPMGAAAAQGMTAPTTGKIYENDEPSPLDPPSGAEKDMMVRLTHAEAGNQGPKGMQAVAEVIRSRAVNGGYGGDTPTGVMTQKGQFEPMMTPDGRKVMADLPAGSPQYARVAAAIDQAYGPESVTGGAKNFYAPKAQAELAKKDGRPVVPSFAMGRVGQDIGDHRFYGGVQQPGVQTAALGPPGAMPDAPAPAAGVVPQQAAPQAPAPVQMVQAQPQARTTPEMPEAMRLKAMDLWKSGARGQAAAMEIYKQYMKPTDQYVPITNEKGQVVGQRSTLTGEMKANPTRSEYNIEHRADGAIISVNKNDPADYTIVKPPNAGQEIADQKGLEATAREAGEARGKAVANLPVAIEKANLALQTIDKLSSHPGKAWALGASSYIPPIRGTATYDFVAMLDQAKGQVFLDAYEGLKGGGAITDTEGKKAEAARARLDRAQTPEAFAEALNDFKAVIVGGLKSAHSKAGKAAPEGPAASAPVVWERGPDGKPRRKQ